MPEPSGNRVPSGKGWPAAGSHHCVVVRDGGTKRMGRVQKPCEWVPKQSLSLEPSPSFNRGQHGNAATAWRGSPTGIWEQGKWTQGFPGNLWDPSFSLREEPEAGRHWPNNAPARRKRPRVLC